MPPQGIKDSEPTPLTLGQIEQAIISTDEVLSDEKGVKDGDTETTISDILQHDPRLGILDTDMTAAKFLQDIGLTDNVQPYLEELKASLTPRAESSRLDRTLAFVNAVIAPMVATTEQYHPATMVMERVFDIVNRSTVEPYQPTQDFISTVRNQI